MNDKLQQLQQIINTSSHIVAFTGAGYSTESGVPDFRSRAQKIGSYDYVSTEIVP